MSTVNEESNSSSSGGMADSAKANGNKPGYAFKPGRKFGLTGQRQNPHQHQVFVNSFTSGGSSADGRRMSVREEQRNSWMYSLSVHKSISSTDSSFLCWTRVVPFPSLGGFHLGR